MSGTKSSVHQAARPEISALKCGKVIMGLSTVLLLSGCTTPDLKPFAEASKTLSVSVNKGGDLAIKPLAKMPIWVKDGLVEPGDPAHPYTALQAQWTERQNVMEAVLVYSASLEAISDAAAHRNENATELVGSVQQLASAVPGYGAAFNSAGTLVVKGLEITVEVKAWHDMRRAVEAADPAIQLVARGIKLDFTEISHLYEAPLNDQLAKLGASIRPVVRFEHALREQRDAQRKLVETDPSDSVKGAELARLDGLYATAVADLNQIRSGREKVEDEIAQGKEFFASAIQAVDAWAGANAELVKAFKDQRTPNFTLLIARAEELKEIVNQLKTK
jgi:hypothetical protein